MAVADSLFVLFKLFHFVSLAFFTEHLLIYNTTALYGLVVLSFETLLTLLCISVERYRATRRTVQILQPLSMKARTTFLSVSWIISLSLSLFVFFQDIKIYIFPIFLTLALLYNVCMSCLSILTFIQISKPQAIENNLSDEQRQHRRTRIRNAVKLVLYSLLLYSCCYFPWLCSEIYAFAKKGCFEDSPFLGFVIWHVLPLVNSCCSPWIYCVCLKDFGEAAKKVLFRKPN